MLNCKKSARCVHKIPLFPSRGSVYTSDRLWVKPDLITSVKHLWAVVFYWYIALNEYTRRTKPFDLMLHERTNRCSFLSLIGRKQRRLGDYICVFIWKPMCWASQQTATQCGNLELSANGHWEMLETYFVHFLHNIRACALRESRS